MLVWGEIGCGMIYKEKFQIGLTVSADMLNLLESHFANKVCHQILFC